VKAAAERSPLEKTVYIVSSKSGGTSEVMAFLDFFWAALEEKVGPQVSRHFVAITDPGTSLENLARERGFRAVFLADETVGGRNSALTAFGLVPAALIGINVERLLDRAAAMAAQCAADVPAGRNPGLVLGAIIGEGTLAGRDKLTILTDPELDAFGSWAEQLIAESSGKQGKGIVPVDLEPLAEPTEYSSDRVFVYLRQSGQLDDRVRQLIQAGHPVPVIDVTGPYDLSAEFFRWEYATAIATAILGVNSFDQPDVQDNKDRTKAKINAYQQNGSFDEGRPIWEGDKAKVYGRTFEGLKSDGDLPQVVEQFVRQAGEGDYIAINAYVPRNAETLASLQKLRARIQQLTGRATTMGFGPRFLHSTGQLHKGGPNNGVFLQITQAPQQDVEIPTQGMTFGTLERAQALGDLEALQARERRAIRVHLDKNANIEDLI
jgi:transaldolase/glucose-6-phosphate isomerase